MPSNAVDDRTLDGIGRSMTVPSTVRLSGRAEPERYGYGTRTTVPSTPYCTVTVRSPSL
jgi:hypothetical protein